MMLIRRRTDNYSRSQGGSGRGGFLLVEVLATMAISAFLLAALVSVVSLMLRTSDRVGTKSQQIEDSSRILASLAREIQQIVPVRWPGPDTGFVFQGTSQGMAYAREVLLPDGSTDMRVVFLKKDGNKLTRTEARLLPSNASFSALAPLRIENVTPARLAVRFGYFARVENGQEALMDNWSDRTQLPVAINITLTDASGRVLGATRVQLRVDAEPGCAAPEKKVPCNFVRDTRDSAEPQTADSIGQNSTPGLEQ